MPEPSFKRIRLASLDDMIDRAEALCQRGRKQDGGATSAAEHQGRAANDGGHASAVAGAEGSGRAARAKKRRPVGRLKRIAESKKCSIPTMASLTALSQCKVLGAPSWPAIQLCAERWAEVRVAGGRGRAAVLATAAVGAAFACYARAAAAAMPRTRQPARSKISDIHALLVGEEGAAEAAPVPFGSRKGPEPEAFTGRTRS